jgi:dynein heavy chain 1, cytosolic
MLLISSHIPRPKTQTQVWLGGLFFPEAFITATRQLAAQRLNRSLEELSLSLRVGASGGDNDDDEPHPGADSVGFAVRGLWVEGAAWEEEMDGGSGGRKGGRLSLSGGAIRGPLPLAWLCWTAGEEEEEEEEEDSARTLTLPVYLDDSRVTLVGQVRYAGKLQAGVSLNAWAQRGAAIVAWRGVV